jgi:hypothetical protein
MYMHADQIAELLARSGIRADLYDALYSSADTKVSKASGGIFDRIDEAAHAHRVVHVGDSLRGDYLNPEPSDGAHCFGRSRTCCLTNGKKTMRPAWLSFGSGTAWISKGRSRHEGVDPQRRRCGKSGPRASHRLRSVGAGRPSLAPCPAPASAVPRRRIDRCPLLRARGRSDPSSTTSFLEPIAPARTGARMFWVSRIAVAKGVFDTPAWQGRSIELLTREYRHQPLRDLVSGLMRQCPEILSGIDLQDRSLDAHGHNLRGLVDGQRPGPASRAGLPEGQHRRLRRLSRRRCSTGVKRALLIDSGWQGTTQSLLTAAHPDTHWRGLYFGRILTPAHDPRIVQDCIGLMFEAEHWEPEAARNRLRSTPPPDRSAVGARRRLDRGCARRTCCSRR